MDGKRIAYVRCFQVENIWRYALEFDGKVRMVSHRTFLTKDEAQIESEWLMNQLGLRVIPALRKTNL